MRKYIRKNEPGETFKKCYKNPEILKPDDIDYVIKNYLKNEPSVIGQKRITYINCPCSFDIETTSIEEGDNKIAFMYIWQVCINGAVILGRTWAEFEYVMNRISEKMKLNGRRILIFYVHNLAFECQFIRKRFNWLSVFATEERKPLKMLSDIGIEFRCSYRLSGYGLEKTCENLIRYKVEKKVGDLDYKLIRNSNTVLSDEELGYCVNDVIGVCAFILEEMERNNMKITKIPLTATGYARNLCRFYCFGKGNRYKEIEYQNFIRDFTLDTMEYNLLKEAYQGGFTHANAKHAGEIQYDITSYDFTSSYPAVLVAFPYPMGKGEYYKVKDDADFEDIIKNKHCVFRIRFYNIRAKENIPDNIISESKCRNIIYGDDPHPLNNGRIRHAKVLETTITEIDYQNIKAFYDWDRVDYGTMITYKKGYLPTGFIEAILYLYKAKTELKGIAGKEEEYQHAKALLNALYGMLCLDPVKDEVLLLDEWTCGIKELIKENGDIKEYIKKIKKEAIQRYNEDSKRFSHYSWGVYCTAYARRNLLLSMNNITVEDHNYSDTDSMKIFNADKHLEYIEKYNKWITKRIQTACLFHHLPLNSFVPKTKEGVEKPIGVWDYDGHYDMFKTIGAKKYMTLSDDIFSLTVSGVNKTKAIPYLLDSENIGYYKDKKGFHITTNKEKIINIFLRFNEGLEIPKEYSGKLCSTYLDDEIAGIITDYQGNVGEYKELSAVHLGETTYRIGDMTDYLFLLDWLR